jgi:hypothetical protein
MGTLHLLIAPWMRFERTDIGSMNSTGEARTLFTSRGFPQQTDALRILSTLKLKLEQPQAKSGAKMLLLVQHDRSSFPQACMERREKELQTWLW